MVQDESIFVYDYIFKRKKWISVNKRPVVTVTGCRRKTIVFGSLSIDNKQLFVQYDKFNSNTFADYLKQIQNRFGKCIVFVDRATPHCSAITRKYLAENTDKIKLEYLPVGCPEFNTVKACGRQGKYNILSCYYPAFDSLKDSISSHYRTRKFNLDIIKYLMRTIE
ncbi:MAG: transposase [Nitrososphaeraceae archaeon]